MYYACFRAQGKLVMKKTEISITEYPAARAKKLAQAIADSMQAIARKDVSLAKAIDAVRWAADMHAGTAASSIAAFYGNFECGGNEHSKAKSRMQCKRFVEWMGKRANEPLDTLTRETCSEYIRHLAKDLRIGTIKSHKTYLSSAANEAVRRDLMRRNPWVGISVAKEIEATGGDASDFCVRDPFTADEIKRIIKEFPNPWRDIVMLCVLTGGQRLGDVVSMKWESVDFDNDVIMLKTGKTNRSMQIPMLASLKRMLLARKSYSEYIFPDEFTVYSRGYSTLSNEFVNLLIKHGIAKRMENKGGSRKATTDKSFHSLRHSVVSMLRNETIISNDVTRELVGHSSEDVERGYFKASKEKIQIGLSFIEENLNIG